MKKEDGQISLASSADQEKYKQLRQLLSAGLELGGEYWNWPLAGYLTLPTLQRILNLNFIYDLQLKSAGSIMEFGVHYGSSFAQLINLRSAKEPFNYSRHIYGFDTFSGFKGVTNNDASATDGDFKIAETYEEHLERVCTLHESFAPKSHLKKFTLIKGDASETVEKLLHERPELVISLAIFDMDIYQPTKNVLRQIKTRLHHGSLLVFDEFNCPHFPGETQAVIEEFGLNNLEFLQSPFLPYNTICRFHP